MAFRIIFHVASLLAFIAFFMHDQLKLRLVLGLSLALQIIFVAFGLSTPDYEAIFWITLTLAANVYMIVTHFRDLMYYGIPADTRGLFDRIGVLTPGEFRKLIASAARTPGAGQVLITAGEALHQLHFLARGEAELQKGAQAFTLKPGVFLGEVAFLCDVPASASVRLREGATCLTWDSAGLRKLMDDNKAIGTGLRGTFNTDLAYKVAASMPAEQRIEMEARAAAD